MAKRIWLHGLGQGPESWQQVLTQLPPMEETCPGLFALPDSGEELTYLALYQAFCCFCQTFSEPLHLCGLSLGAVLALNFAAEYPERVASLVLIAPQERAPNRLLKLQNLLFRLMLERAFRSMGLSKAQLLSLMASMTGLDLGLMVGQVGCPTLLLCGERDTVNRKAAIRLVEKLPHARFCQIPGAGHEANIQAPKALASLLAEFYAGL